VLTSDFDYNLTDERIAQHPLADRSASRVLMAPSRIPLAGHGDPVLFDGRIADLPELLPTFLERQGCYEAAPGPTKRPPLVLVNDSRVYPARIPIRRRRGDCGYGEVVLLGLDEARGQAAGQVFGALLRPQKKMRVGDQLFACGEELSSGRPLFEVVSLGSEPGTSQVRALLPALEIVETYGCVPLPPYIERAKNVGPQGSRGSSWAEWDAQDKARYQTVYARAIGSAAAPTAGLHLTKELMDELESKELARFARVTLHVGLGTFRPVQTETVSKHVMHSESFSIPDVTIEALLNAIQNKDPVIYIGTTTFRAMETFLLRVHEAFAQLEDRKTSDQDQTVPLSHAFADAMHRAADQWHTTNLFVHPQPHWSPFQCYAPMLGNGMLTNFHQPKSTLLMLVAALVGRSPMQSVYRHALDNGYRFLSYGDASLIGFGCSGRLRPQVIR
jgi:S-adenosylmethionine:tRNA ribosyltransferase-isomerase